MADLVPKDRRTFALWLFVATNSQSISNPTSSGDEDGFVNMWDTRVSDSSSVMSFKRFDEYVSSFLKIDDRILLAASGEGTIQSFDLKQRKPDIQSEVSYPNED